MEQLTAPSGRRNGSSAPSPADQSGLDELASELAARRLDIFDEWTVTALLESSGLGDGDARQRYGLPDLFCIGRLLFPRLPRCPGSVLGRCAGCAGWLRLSLLCFGFGGYYV